MSAPSVTTSAPSISVAGLPDGVGAAIISVARGLLGSDGPQLPDRIGGIVAPLLGYLPVEVPFANNDLVDIIPAGSLPDFPLLVADWSRIEVIPDGPALTWSLWSSIDNQTVTRTLTLGAFAQSADLNVDFPMPGHLMPGTYGFRLSVEATETCGTDASKTMSAATSKDINVRLHAHHVPIKPPTPAPMPAPQP